MIVQTQEELNLVRTGGQILAQIFKELKEQVKPGLKAEDLNLLAESLCLKYGVEPAFKNYKGYPFSICFSLNQELVHGLPKEKVLKEGDILSLDFGIKYKGIYFDKAITLPVGKVSPEALRLIKITKKALKRALKKVRAGNTVGDIGNAIQRYIEAQKLGLVKELAGHGIGKELHEPPQILNYGKRHKGAKLVPGMLICIEPMITLGSGKVKKLSDGFTYISADNTLSSHFEDTVMVLKDGFEVLTEVKE